MTYTFNWNRMFETGISSVDDQHRELVAIINTLGNAVAEHRAMDGEEAKRLLAELQSYALEHFSAEVSLMKEVGIDRRHLDQHRAAHGYFVGQVRGLLRTFSPDGREHSELMLKFLSSWLAHHILGVDQIMARQLDRIRAGASPRQAYDAEVGEPRGPVEPLLDALHGLFEQVAERNGRLEALAETLERRVADRTEELSDLVATLELEKAESHRLSQELVRTNHQLEELATTDALTGLPNRRHAIAKLGVLWDDPAEEPLSVIVIDADDFKAVNDNYGHESGDVVLRTLAREMNGAVRTDDTVCRMGGDEFLVLCPQTPLSGAEMVAGAIVSRVGALEIRVEGGVWAGGISAGVAQRTANQRDATALLAAADEALYAAKDAGRGCVRSHDRSRYTKAS